MKSLLCLTLVLTATAAANSPVRPADVVGSWRDHEGVIYVLHPDSSYRLTYADSIISGTWALHSDGTLELTPYGNQKHREVILIESLVKDILQLRRSGKRDVWIKNP
jgi:hypothetical protein